MSDEINAKISALEAEMPLPTLGLCLCTVPTRTRFAKNKTLIAKQA